MTFYEKRIYDYYSPSQNQLEPVAAKGIFESNFKIYWKIWKKNPLINCSAEPENFKINAFLWGIALQGCMMHDTIQDKSDAPNA